MMSGPGELSHNIEWASMCEPCFCEVQRGLCNVDRSLFQTVGNIEFAGGKTSLIAAWGLKAYGVDSGRSLLSSLLVVYLLVVVLTSFLKWTPYLGEDRNSLLSCCSHGLRRWCGSWAMPSNRFYLVAGSVWPQPDLRFQGVELVGSNIA